MSNESNNEHGLDDATAERLTNAVIEILGNSGREAISVVQSGLYDRGWHNIGSIYRLETLLIKLGFNVYEGWNERNQDRTTVALLTDAEERQVHATLGELRKLYRETEAATLAAGKSRPTAREKAHKAVLLKRALIATEF